MEKLNDVRIYWMRNILGNMPPGMATTIGAASMAENITLFLSALKCNRLIEEWCPLLMNISSFVYDMYRVRYILYEQFSDQIPCMSP